MISGDKNDEMKLISGFNYVNIGYQFQYVILLGLKFTILFSSVSVNVDV